MMLHILLQIISFYHFIVLTQSFLLNNNQLNSRNLTYKQLQSNQVIKREIRLKLTPNDNINANTNSMDKRRLYILEHVVNILKKKVIQYYDDINDLKQQVRTTNLVHYSSSIYSIFTVIILLKLIVVGRCQSKSSEI